jgi:hypothetical protein
VLRVDDCAAFVPLPPSDLGDEPDPALVVEAFVSVLEAYLAADPLE